MAQAHSTTAGAGGAIRNKIFKNVLLDVARDDPASISEDFVDEQTLFDVLSSSRQTIDRIHEDTDRSVRSESLQVEWKGVLSENDILRFGLASPRSELGPHAQHRLEEELDKLLSAMAEFFHADVDWDSLDETEQLRLALSLPEDIESYQNTIETTRSDLNAVYNRVEALTLQINEAHSHLQLSLSQALSKHPPHLNKKRSASHDLLAATIETSLIKLSLLRARAHQALYAHPSSKGTQQTLAHALSAAHVKLTKDTRKMADEERALDRQLAEYETMLRLVDGDGGGGFAQVVEDWTRVQKEKEECRRDLRRLGWTGD
ncbi:hypothetical protein Hypma_009080 [Hypsizygus marmoreus]|uniref:Uncharacterized protein n=1 Tax=Hypsizygus marmoreus TaxID=39966 RepID=A0A369JVK1_HYPMA|nr:hypothetical protein Hypma_009080 [Hypsizygus marmoreus]